MIKVLSKTDVITNSSTEVFIVRFKTPPEDFLVSFREFEKALTQFEAYAKTLPIPEDFDNGLPDINYTTGDTIETEVLAQSDGDLRVTFSEAYNATREWLMGINSYVSVIEAWPDSIYRESYYIKAGDTIVGLKQEYYDEERRS